MNQIKRDNYGYSLIFGNIEIFIDDEEKIIRIKQFGNEILNYPLIIFIKEDTVTVVVKLYKLKLELNNLTFIGKVHNEEIIEYINNINSDCIVKYFETSFKTNKDLSLDLFTKLAEDIDINFENENNINKEGNKDEGIEINNNQKKCCLIM